MRWIWILAFGLLSLAGCTPASERVSPERLRISAADAAKEARTIAAGWTPDATLWYVEGEGVTPDGYVLPESGQWRLVYEAPGRADQLVVVVTPRTVDQAVRPRQPPPGFTPDRTALPEDWIDSPQALAAARAASAEAILTGPQPALSLLLAPLRPPQWVIRVAAGNQVHEWRVDARSGAVLP
ncbi:MAG TPA: hypothetical protein VIL13_12595 [Longimicrobiales bacterium]|jgi:hypothetical protein